VAGRGVLINRNRRLAVGSGLTDESDWTEISPGGRAHRATLPAQAQGAAWARGRCHAHALGLLLLAGPCTIAAGPGTVDVGRARMNSK